MANAPDKRRDDDDDLAPWERAETLPSTQTRTAPQPWERAETLGGTTAPGLTDTLAGRLRSREQVLTDKLNPERKTGFGRVGQVLGTVGQDIGAAVAPRIMEEIPGTTLNRRAELGRVREMLGPEQARETLGQTEQARTELERQKNEIEMRKAGMPRMLPPGPETVRTNDATQVRQNLWEIPGQPAQWIDEGDYPKAAGPAAPLPPAGIPGTLGGGGGAAAPPAPAPGTLPRTQAPPAPAGAPPPTAPPQYTYGKPAEGQIPLKPDEIKQINDEAASFFKGVNKPVDPAFQLHQGATKEDAARLQEMIKAQQSAAGAEATRQSTEQARKDSQARAQEALDLRKDEAAGKWVRAIDNEGKMHYMTRGDYDARSRDFQPNPGILPPGSIEKATDHNTILNEMQGRMNAAAESAVNFNWKDTGQKNLVIQALQQVEQSYADKVIGIPITDFLAQNLKKLGLSGATPQTREYIIDLLSLREAMLGMPKEITGGSRMMEKSIEALYATLPGGTTPDRAWAMHQLQATQSIMDRLRGSRVPIIEGLHQIGKVPELYKYNAVNPKTKQEIFSDDNKTWVDENGRPVKR